MKGQLKHNQGTMEQQESAKRRKEGAREHGSKDRQEYEGIQREKNKKKKRRRKRGKEEKRKRGR